MMKNEMKFKFAPIILITLKTLSEAVRLIATVACSCSLLRALGSLFLFVTAWSDSWLGRVLLEAAVGSLLVLESLSESVLESLLLDLAFFLAGSYTTALLSTALLGFPSFESIVDSSWVLPRLQIILIVQMLEQLLVRLRVLLAELVGDGMILWLQILNGP